MKGRRIAGILGISLGISMLAAGCASTPENSVVRQKGKSSMENYQEAQEETSGQQADARQAVSGQQAESGEAASGQQAESGEAASGQQAESGEAASGQQADAGQAVSGQQVESGEAASGAQADGGEAASGLREALGAPERYQSETEDATGKLQILTDAQVEVPAADYASAITVTQLPFEQELIDRITETFFGDSVIYDLFSYTQMTKADWQARLEELKGYAAAGNLDPYGYGTDEDGNYTYDLYGSIEAAEQQYQNAPEERTLRQVKPQFGLEIDYGNGETWKSEDDFQGVVETAEGETYYYSLARYGAMPIEVRIKKRPAEDSGYSSLEWLEYEMMRGGNPEAPDEETVKADVGMTLEEAQRIGDEKVGKLEIPNMELLSWEYALQYGEGDGMSEDSGYRRERQTNAGYILHYGRRLGGIPVTYTMEFGGGLESMDSEMETWGYEILDLYVTKEGVDSVLLLNLYELGETRTERLELLPFEEIMEIYEKMMVIQNADVINYESSRTYRVNRIAFGYSRIYEPASDSKSGLLVPVWDFFGEFEAGRNDGQSDYDYRNTTKFQSYLTINAVDGSIIDRGLGY